MSAMTVLGGTAADNAPKPVDVGDKSFIERPYVPGRNRGVQVAVCILRRLEVVTQHNLSTTVAPGGAPVRLRCMRQGDHFRY